MMPRKDNIESGLLLGQTGHMTTLRPRLPTQPYSAPESQDQGSSQKQTETQGCSVKVWGYLDGMRYGLPSMIPLQKEKYLFGRYCKSDFKFDQNAHNLDKSTYFEISNEHFVIYKKGDKVMLEDCSSNGTFVNGRRVRDSDAVLRKETTKVVLRARDKIALLDAKKPWFSFLIFEDNIIEKDMPSEIRSRFRVTKLLGSGGSASVFLVYEGATGKEYAMKKIDKNFATPGMNSVEFVQNEIRILKSITNRCIVKVQDVIDLEKETFIVMEYMAGGSLACKLKADNYKPICEALCRVYCYQLLQALHYLDSKSIIHRDIKPENILLFDKEDTRVKLADFGLSKLVSHSRKAVTCCGSYEYVAPEVIKSDGKAYSSKVDIWSLGVTLFFCMSGRLPFVSNDTAELKQLILSGSYSMKGPQWNSISTEGREVVMNMLKINPEERHSALKLLHSHWFAESKFLHVKLSFPAPPVGNTESPPRAKKMCFDKGAHCSKTSQFLPQQPTQRNIK